MTQYTTPAYKEAAARTILDEANQVCRELNLHEKLPIKENDLIEVHISSPFISDHARSVGGISTSNFDYSASQGNKLCYISKHFNSEADREKDWLFLKAKYLTSSSQINTNAAYMLATQWLAAAAFDVKQLEHDSKVEIKTWKLGDNFVPVYWIRWLQPYVAVNSISDPPPSGMAIIATVELLMPEHKLRILRVEKPEYNERKPLIIHNRDDLLEQTDNQMLKKAFFTTDAYKKEAFG